MYVCGQTRGRGTQQEGAEMRGDLAHWLAEGTVSRNLKAAYRLGCDTHHLAAASFLISKTKQVLMRKESFLPNQLFSQPIVPV